MRRLESLLVTFWAGSLWTICGVVAPVLFATLEDRRLAGELAGHFFRIEAWLGFAIAIALSGILISREPRGSRGGKLVLIAVTAGAPLASEGLVRPIMDAARATGDMARFGMLHGVSAALFAIACVTALVLAWRVNRPAA